MALGKPVVTFLHDEAAATHRGGVRRARAAGQRLRRRRSGIGSPGSIEIGPEGRAEIGAASRAYVERVHDLERVTDQLLDLYAAVRRAEAGVAARPSARSRRARHSSSDPQAPLDDPDLETGCPRPSAPEPLPPPTPRPAGLGKQLGRLSRHSAIYGIGGLVSRVIAVLLLPLYTHYLTPADYGKIETLLALTTVMGLLLRAGITSAFFRFYFDAEDDAGRRLGSPDVVLVHDGRRDARARALCSSFADPVSQLLFGTDDAANLVRAAGVSLWATVNYEQLTALFRVEERSVAFVVASLANVFITIGATPCARGGATTRARSA